MNNIIQPEQIEIKFIQSQSGWIEIQLKVKDLQVKVEASSAFPPFEELIKFLEDIISGNLPSSFILDEEGVYKQFNALPYPYGLFQFVLGFPVHNIYIQGIFDRKQFVSEFYQKFVEFLSSGYDKDRWTHSDDKLDLRRIHLDKLKKTLEKE